MSLTNVTSTWLPPQRSMYTGQSSEYDGLAEVNSDSDVEEGPSNFEEGTFP